MQESHEMLHLLALAKAKDHTAMGRIASYVWDKWGYRIRKFYSPDPAEDADDLQQTYWLAVIEGLDIVDERGNPLFHLNQRGCWKVGAKVRSKRAFARMLSLDATVIGEDADGLTHLDRYPDPQESPESVVVSQIGSCQQVEILGDVDLPPIAERAMLAILEDKAGDPTELGFNKRLATALEVSPQRASQAMAALRVTMGGAMREDHYERQCRNWEAKAA